MMAFDFSHYQRQWEGLSHSFETHDTASARVARHLTEITDFGSNPGNLRMLVHVPAEIAPGPALVIALHGCSQTAIAYDQGAGWSALADKHGFFVLLPEQQSANNPMNCFSWFERTDMGRDQGEPLSIRQMVEKMIVDHGIDRSRVFITGLSAGGAMTAVMLATYPEVFAGGAIIAGLPYGTACNFHEAFQSMLHGTEREAKTWGDLVRAASPHGGPWPKLSIWHGTEDTTVKPLNAGEIVKQWSDLHGVNHAAPLHETVDNYPRRVWYGPLGDAILEEYELTGMDHGTPVDTNHVEAAGDAGPFFLDVGISSTYHIARFWGLLEKTPKKSATEPEMAQPSAELIAEPVVEEVFLVSEAAPVVPELESMPVVELPLLVPHALTPVAFAAEPAGEAEFFAEEEEEIEDQNDEDRHSFFDLHGLLNKALKAAGLIKP